jgi:hypothetical protein
VAGVKPVQGAGLAPGGGAGQVAAGQAACMPGRQAAQSVDPATSQSVWQLITVVQRGVQVGRWRQGTQAGEYMGELSGGRVVQAR